MNTLAFPSPENRRNAGAGSGNTNILAFPPLKNRGIHEMGNGNCKNRESPSLLKLDFTVASDGKSSFLPIPFP